MSRSFARGVAAFALGPLLTFAAASPTLAADYPTHSVRIIVPAGPGGTVDILSRLLAGPISKHMGQNVVVENQPGAGTDVGLEAIATAKPDGYTFLVVSSAISVNVSLHPSPRYDPRRDLASVMIIGAVPGDIVVAANSPYKTMGDLLAAAKAQPGKLNYSSGGNGSSANIAIEYMKSLTGTNIVHVPYKSISNQIPDLLNGSEQLTLLTIPASLGPIKAGTMRALAVTGTTRSPALPDVPTMQEAGVPTYDWTSWQGLYTPAGTPPEYVQRMNDEFRYALNLPEIKAKLSDLGLEPVASTPEEASKFLKSEVDKWAGVIKAANIKDN